MATKKEMLEEMNEITEMGRATFGRQQFDEDYNTVAAALTGPDGEVNWTMVLELLKLAAEEYPEVPMLGLLLQRLTAQQTRH